MRSRRDEHSRFLKAPRVNLAIAAKLEPAVKIKKSGQIPTHVDHTFIAEELPVLN